MRYLACSSQVKNYLFNVSYINLHTGIATTIVYAIRHVVQKDVHNNYSFMKVNHNLHLRVRWLFAVNLGLSHLLFIYFHSLDKV